MASRSTGALSAAARAILRPPPWAVVRASLRARWQSGAPAVAAALLDEAVAVATATTSSSAAAAAAAEPEAAQPSPPATAAVAPVYTPTAASLRAPLPPADKEVASDALKAVAASREAQRLAERDHAIAPALWQQVLAKLRRRLVAAPGGVFKPTAAAAAAAADDGGDAAAAAVDDEPRQLGRLHAFLRAAHAALADPPSAMPALVDATLPHALALAQEAFGEQLSVARVMRQCTDLREPHAWYPLARSMKRRVIFHAGPTNSGKTYHALRALKDAHSGVYCGPLRLLALEVYESMNMDGVETSLMTGQERRELPFARHKSCTIEMVDVNTRLDVAVVDEIQMIGDPQRGSSWTRALLGLPCPEVHVCGDPAAIPAVTAVLAATGDTLEIVHYSRLSQLSVSPESLGSDYGRVQPGDCVVAFSRKDIYTIRRTIERKTAHKCCVVYGSLPPETRSQQARLFNDPGSGYDVLVASDAIGMGLNLNIRRIVFHTMDKFNGTAVGPVVPAQVKQIAGRAGRHGSIYPRGFATALADDDLPYLKSCWEQPSPPITAAGLFPNVEQLAALAAHLPPDTELSTLVDKFVTASQIEGPFFMCRADDIKLTAALLQPFPLSLPQRCALALAPINLKHPEVRAYFLRYLEAYVGGRPVRLDLELPHDDPGYLARDLEVLEVKHHALDLYLWLTQRMGPAWFPDMALAMRLREDATRMLETALTTLSEETKGDWEREMTARRAKHARLEGRRRAAVLSSSAASASGGYARGDTAAAAEDSAAASGDNALTVGAGGSDGAPGRRYGGGHARNGQHGHDGNQYRRRQHQSSSQFETRHTAGGPAAATTAPQPSPSPLVPPVPPASTAPATGAEQEPSFMAKLVRRRRPVEQPDARQAAASGGSSDDEQHQQRPQQPARPYQQQQQQQQQQRPMGRAQQHQQHQRYDRDGGRAPPVRSAAAPLSTEAPRPAGHRGPAADAALDSLLSTLGDVRAGAAGGSATTGSSGASGADAATAAVPAGQPPATPAVHGGGHREQRQQRLGSRDTPRRTQPPSKPAGEAAAPLTAAQAPVVAVPDASPEPPPGRHHHGGRLDAGRAAVADAALPGGTGRRLLVLRPSLITRGVPGASSGLELLGGDI
jgi:ATP-dependent RNA helicase SUPV3L1/SUV3